ncbi:MAG: phosphoglucosamine mutase [Sediminibacterium sp.]|nr:phosphoglucosamine mutase [Sediminibacterium sp.]
MALKSSISGIRGTIGFNNLHENAAVHLEDSLTPFVIVQYAAAYFTWILSKNINPIVVIGRDGRNTGEMIQNIIQSVGIAMGIHIMDIGLTTTPTVEMSVVDFKAQGGLMVSASHNPSEWNGIKPLNELGEFLDEANFNIIENYRIQNNHFFTFVPYNKLGKIIKENNAMNNHIQKIISLDLVDVIAIKNANFNIVIDVINSTGIEAIPMLFKQLGVDNFTLIHNNYAVKFDHKPEPLPENLSSLSKAVIENKADLGISVDPDVDRLCFVCEDGSFYGEEYTLVTIADYYTQYKKGACVNNVCSSKSLQEIALKNTVPYFVSKVGEINVVNKMKETNAVIGGEGSGGIIVPSLHYGRDALVGIALFLSYLAKQQCSISTLRKKYPDYPMKKDKIDIQKMDKKSAEIIANIAEKLKNYSMDFTDGLKIIFDEGWVSLRESNTEPIIRIYAEANNEERVNTYIQLIKDLV